MAKCPWEVILALGSHIHVARVRELISLSHARNPQLALGAAWQPGYGAFSISKSNVPGVMRYISKQEIHHRRITFKEEFIDFLIKHQIEYEERCIWN